MKYNWTLSVGILIMGMLFSHCKSTQTLHTDTALKIYEKNPHYWEYKGKPILLIGGSGHDNLFNHPEGLEKHLEVLKKNGGNYVRNTMSSRNPGNPWAFKKLENGLFDLDQWDEKYWSRFENFLQMCYLRDIIVQIEIWDPWDYFKSEASRGFGPENVGWESCPYNPDLNINYTVEETGLANEIDYFSGRQPSSHLFFHSIPELKNIPGVLYYQERFVEKILSITMLYPNILYCINNEIGEPHEWGQYWARFIQNTTREKGKDVFIADMRRNSNFESDEQKRLLNDREHYDYFEISQVNSKTDQDHFDMIMVIREQLLNNPMPINSVKVYGGKIGRWTTSVEEGTRRFWRTIFAGGASVRFHREGPSEHFFGIGLSDLAQTHIRSMRMFTERFHVFSSIPKNDLLSNRSPNEAYCLADPGRQYAVYFPGYGDIDLSLSKAEEKFEIHWLDILNNAWKEAVPVDSLEFIPLKTPGDGQWVAVVLPVGQILD
jgi:hypothetical protein